MQDLSRLKLEGELDETIASVPPEQILLRWFNYHLAQAGHHRKVTNFSSDIKVTLWSCFVKRRCRTYLLRMSVQDSENYSILLAQICPEKIGNEELHAALREKDHLKRAEIVLDMAEKLNCRKFVTANDIVEVIDTVYVGSSFLNSRREIPG